MASVCFYFQVHQPYRVKPYKIFDIGKDHNYFNANGDIDLNNKKILDRVSEKCYLPTNNLLMDILDHHPECRFTFSLSGVFLDQLEELSPETLNSFKKLFSYNQVEVLNETYYHSLSFLYSKEEFRKQVKLHKEKIMDVFKIEPKAFRNTELIYHDEIAKEVEKMGYDGVLTEGADHILGWQSPNFLYKAKDTSVNIMMKNYKLSDDIAFRFSEEHWKEHPLTAEKFGHWVSQINGNGHVVNLFMDYETFGEHQWEDTGIFDFLRQLPKEIFKHPDNDFVTVSEALNQYEPMGEIEVDHYVSWADVERDLSAWLSNDMQEDALKKVYELEEAVLNSNNENIKEDWRKLQTSDHFYYMCTKWFSDGDVHKYFNPYESPYEAFINYMNTLKDLKLRLNKA